MFQQFLHISVDKLKGRMTALTFEPIKRVDVTLVLQHDLLNGPLPPLVDLGGLLSLLVVADHDGRVGEHLPEPESFLLTRLFILHV